MTKSSKGSESFKPRAGRRCPKCHVERRHPAGEVYVSRSWEKGYQVFTQYGCDVCDASWTLCKNKSLVDTLVPLVRVVDLQQRQPYTYVAIQVGWGETMYHDIGFSKVCHPDVWNAATGQNKAVRQAVAAIVQEHKLRIPVPGRPRGIDEQP